MGGGSLRVAGHTRDTGYRSGRSPVGLGGAVAVHGAAVAIFLLMPKEMIPFVDQWKPFIGTNVPIDPPPPPQQQDDSRPEAKTQPTRDMPTRADAEVELPVKSSGMDGTITPPPGSGDTGGGDMITPPPQPQPVYVEPQIDPRALPGFQPDYPPQMIRLDREGSVTVRVQIGIDGRVTDVALASATDDAFWTATERHALRKWRFRPATRDGVPISATKVLTVHFRLQNR